MEFVDAYLKPTILSPSPGKAPAIRDSELFSYLSSSAAISAIISALIKEIRALVENVSPTSPNNPSLMKRNKSSFADQPAHFS